MNHIEYLKSLNACEEAVEWAAEYPDLATAWDKCHRSDWMLWLDQNANLLDDRTRRMLACAFVRRTPLGDGRTVWDLLTDERSRTAVEVAERHANGEATDKELAAARDAADAARDAADAARDAAWDAARDAAWAAAWHAAWYAADAASDAASGAWNAARDAAWHAAWYAADAASDAASGAWDAARAAQADIIREIAGNPFRKEHLR